MPPKLLTGFRYALVTEFNLGTVTTNQIVDCAGVFAVSVLIKVASAFSPLLSFTDLDTGVPVNIQFWNNAGTTNHLILAATTPASVSYVFNPGLAYDSTGATVLANTAVFLHGSSFIPPSGAPSLLLMS